MSRKNPRRAAQSGDYAVGKGKPPREYQFPKGVSGNLGGRPRKVQTIGEKIHHALYRPVKVRAGESVQEIAVIDAIIHATAAQALAGDLRATDLLLRLYDRFHNDPAVTFNPKDLAEDDRKILQNFMRRQSATMKGD
jgi:hypothetical protein